MILKMMCKIQANYVDHFESMMPSSVSFVFYFLKLIKVFHSTKSAKALLWLFKGVLRNIIILKDDKKIIQI